LSLPDVSEEIVRAGVAAAMDKKAADLLVLHVGSVASFADFFVICTATSDRQASAIVENIEFRLRQRNKKPISIEGKSSGRWILIDYGDVVFHVFLDEARHFYGLERLWGDAGNETERFSAAW
jgi:ribosome-associated protein